MRIFRDWTLIPGRRLIFGQAVLALVFLGWMIFQWGGEAYRAAISDLAFLPAGFLTAFSAWLASRDRGLSRRLRRSWVLIALAFAATWLGDVVWAYIELVLRGTPSPSWADIGYLLFYPLLLFGTLSLLPAFTDRGQRARYWLDLVTVMLGGWMVVWYFVLGPTALASEEDRLTTVLSAAYPVGDLLLLYAVAALMLRRPPSPTGRVLGVLAVGISLFFIADLAFGYMSQLGAYRSGDWPDGLWMASYLFMAVSAQYQRISAPRSESFARPAVPVISWLPYAGVALGYLLLLAGVLRPTAPGVEWGLLTGGALLTLMIVARQIIVLVENQRLTTHLQRSEERFRSLVQNSSDIIFVLAAEGTIIYASPAASRTGLPADAPSIFSIVHQKDQGVLRELYGRLLQTPRASVEVTVRLRAAADTWRWMEIIATNLLDERGVQGIVANCRDVTDRKLLEEQLVHQAFHDPLTGLANRALFQDRLTLALERAHRTGKSAAVLFIDLDDFKVVNDTLGHGAGDELLGMIADRLRSALRAADTIARLGGDEFAMILEDVDGAPGATRAAARFLQALEAPFHLQGQLIAMPASIGIALTREAISPDELLRNADIAMYAAKGHGKHRYEIYLPSMRARIVKRLELESELREAVVRDDFFLEYQPIVALATGQITAVEALLRWRHPTRGMIAPADFISTAEETGLILVLGARVLERALRQVGEWHQRYRRHPQSLTLSVNLSGKQVQSPDLADEVQRLLDHYRVDPSHLIVEITESVTVQEDQTTAQQLSRLRRTGVRVAVDDFGTGYSSLHYLRRLPVDMVKIDQAFVHDSTESAEGAAFARAMIEMARSLGLLTIAEGVETAAQAALMQQLGCEWAHGFYFSRPASAEVIDELLRKDVPLRQAELRA